MGRAGHETADTALEARVRLPLPSEEQGFNIVSRDGLSLIFPRKDMKRQGKDWQEDERPYRSVIVDEDGYVRSIGLPKFYNVGEHEGDTERLAAALEAGREVWLTEKVDGREVP